MKYQNILLYLVAVTIIACDKEKKSESVTEKNTSISVNETATKNVSIVTASLVPEVEEFTTVGEISFDEDNVVRIFPIVSGSVEKIYVSLGDYVNKGDRLATILSTDIIAFQKDFNVAKSNLEVAEKNLNRAKELFQSDIVSEKEFTETQNDFNNARSEYNEKKKKLELYGTSGGPEAVFEVYAPRNGYIVERNINEGTQIRTDNNATLFTISDLKTVWVWANVYESDLTKVDIGDSLSVTTIAYPDKIYKSTITKINTILDPASRVIKVRTELPNESALLKPEMFANVVITSTTGKQVLAVPTNSVMIENNRCYVMKQISPGEFSKIEISTGKTLKDKTQVVSGIIEGAKIANDYALFLLTDYNNSK